MPYYTNNEEDEKLVLRAMSAYFRHDGYMQPNRYDTRVETIEGLRYVVLASGGNHILAVYRVRNDGKLKGLKRWPKEIDE